MKINKMIICIILLCVASLSIGFSAFGTELSISNVVAEVKIEKDVRITGVELISEQSSNVTPNSLNYDVDSIIANVTFNDLTSYITYNITITNIGNFEVGISNINLPEGIENELTNYNLKDKICDGSNKCSLGINKTFSIKIYPTSETGLNQNKIKVDLTFLPFHTITYSNITSSNNYPTSIIENETLSVTFSKPPQHINIYENGIEKDRKTYKYDSTTGTLIYENIISPLIIETAESTLLDGKVFSKTIKDFVNGTTDAEYNSSDTTVTYIGLFEDEIPEGYTEGTFFSLESQSVSENNRIKAYKDNGNVYIYSKDDILAPTSSYSLFRGYTNLTELNIAELNTKNTFDIGAMFQDNKSIKYLDISTFDTTNIYRLFYTFCGNNSLKEIKLPKFNKRSLTNMQHTFADCHNLESLELSYWDTSQLTNMSNTFANCYKLKSIDFTGWNTSNVTEMSYVFRYNQSLTSLDISMFNTSKVTNMNRMFGYCDKLENIYVGSGWDTSNVTTSESMFSNSPLLPNFNQSYIDVSKAYVGEGGYLSYLPE